jgi:antitoxin VapB
MVMFAKLFRNGRSQAIRLPKEFRFSGDTVRIRRMGNGVFVEPVVSDLDRWFEELSALGVSDDFFAGGRVDPAPAPRGAL